MLKWSVRPQVRVFSLTLFKSFVFTNSLIPVHFRSYSVLIRCRVAPPVLVNMSPDVVVRNEGDDVDMFCEATATPPATLAWLKDGRKLASSGHVTVAGNHVVLHGVARSDAGVYSCTFKNGAGSALHLIKLVVQGTLRPPRSTELTTHLSCLSCAVFTYRSCRNLHLRLCRL